MAQARCPKCGGDARKGGTSAGGKQRYRCKDTKCAWNGTESPGTADEAARGIDEQQSKTIRRTIRDRRGVQRYVITAAQNATPVNEKFLASLQGYCKHTGAKLIVIPYRYKNPTSMWSEKAEHDDWWAPELTPYLLKHRTNLNDHLVLFADVMIQPTSDNPLGGFEATSAGQSAIIAHPRLEFTTIATPQQRLPKILTTTGAITVKNYIQSKAGKKGEFHHTFGACVAEVRGGTFHLRQINAVKDGSFCDLDYEYRGAKRTYMPIDTLVLGDVHHEFMDPEWAKGTFLAPDSMINRLKPKVVVWHDPFDMYARSHHHERDPIMGHVKHHTGHGNVERDMDAMFKFVDSVTKPGIINVFPASNHSEHLAQWVKRTPPQEDHENASFICRTYDAMVCGSHWTETGVSQLDPFVHWGKLKLKTAEQAMFLSRGDTFRRHNIELSFHGDKGSNGSRGSRKGYSKIGVKVFIGHGHGPGYTGGAAQVGTGARKMGYTVGSPSNHLGTNGWIYANGKRCLSTVIDGRWFL